MAYAHATDSRPSAEVFRLSPPRARTLDWRLIAVPAVLAACVWLHAQNVALEQRVDREVAAWASAR